MSADLSTVTNMASEILNLSAAGTFSSVIDSNNYDRVADQITESARSGALMIGQAIVSNPGHVHRNLFISATPTALTHQGELPDMAGEGDLIQIKPYSSGSFQAAAPRDVQEIDSYRNDTEFVYDDIAHNLQHSRLSGYYAFDKGRFHFSGYSAQGYFPVLDRTTITGLIPDEYEPIWIALTAGGWTLKEGDNMYPIAQFYMQFGLAGLQSITNMSVIEPLPKPAQERAARGNP